MTFEEMANAIRKEFYGEQPMDEDEALIHKNLMEYGIMYGIDDSDEDHT